MDIADRIVLVLREANISQKEFCKKTGYPESSLSNYLNGTVKSPKMDLIIKLGDFFPKLNLRWLLYEKGEMWVDYLFKEPNEPYLDREIKQKILALEKENALLRDLVKSKEEMIELLKQSKDIGA